MSLPQVVAVAELSPAARAGLQPGDQIVSLNGSIPRDVIEFQLLADEPDVEVDVRRGGIDFTLVVEKDAGQPLGAEISSALFDRVRTCDNHCDFCFIYQLPPGMRKSLYLKDDDYRLSFLYGNFTTLTRFTEADLERVITEKLSPLYVSIHATDPELRAHMLRNRRGAMSLRWLRAILDAGIEVHGQVVVCPDVNDGDVLDDTLCGILDMYPELATVGVVPLGVSKWSTDPGLRPHTVAEAQRVIEVVEGWQETFLELLGRRVVFAADEYYVVAGRPFPPINTYEGFSQHENGIGMATALSAEMRGEVDEAIGPRAGFFAWVDGAPAEGYRAPRAPGSVVFRPSKRAPVAILTGEYGASLLPPLLASVGRGDVRIVPVVNEFFGGNIGVAGLMVGEDLSRVLAREPEGHRYLLPDVCLSGDRFLDGMGVGDLPRPVEIVPTDGFSLLHALEAG